MWVCLKMRAVSIGVLCCAVDSSDCLHSTQYEFSCGVWNSGNATIIHACTCTWLVNCQTIV